MGAEQAALLQQNNNDVLALIDQLYDKKESLEKQIQSLSQTTLSLEQDLSEKIKIFETNKKELKEHQELYDEINKSLVEAELAYSKLVESSDGLVRVLKKDVSELCNK